MALLAYKQVKITGDDITLDPVTGSDTVAPSERGFYEVNNGSGVSVTVTVVVPGSQYGQARPDVAVTVPAGARRKIGPLVPDLADPATGLITITHAPTASVTGAAVAV
jgi:hypothetical protein